MSGFTKGIKALIKDFIDNASKTEPINNISDYRKVKKWVEKTIKLYVVFSVIAIIVIFLSLLFADILESPTFLAYTVFPACILLTSWGYATLIMYLPKVVKSIINAGRIGYNMGEKVETTHVDVTHEYGNTYKVSSHTENKGCLFAVIAGVARFMIWAFFCVYIGPFIMFKKIRASLKDLNNYSAE